MDTNDALHVLEAIASKGARERRSILQETHQIPSEASLNTRDLASQSHAAGACTYQWYFEGT